MKILSISKMKEYFVTQYFCKDINGFFPVSLQWILTITNAIKEGSYVKNTKELNLGQQQQQQPRKVGNLYQPDQILTYGESSNTTFV